MMGHRFYIIDSFTDVAFGGVPVAVFPDANNIPDAYHRALSEEFSASDTVFIQHPAAGKSKTRFSFLSYNQQGRCMPGAHSLIAGLAALVEYGEINRIGPSDIKIETVEDCIESFVNHDSLLHPYSLKRSITPQIDHFVPIQEDIAQIIGLNPEDIVRTHYNCSISHCDSAYLVVPLKSYHAIREAQFNHAAWSASSLPASLVDKILLFAPNTDSSGADIHMRLLIKNHSAKADPAIGEAMPAFAAYLCDQTHIRNGTYSLTIKRGANEARQSFIQLEVDKTDRQTTQLRIGGSTKLTSFGEVSALDPR